MTNGDRIRQILTDEVLAERWYSSVKCDECGMRKICDSGTMMCMDPDRVVGWLKSEEDEDDGDR